MARRSLSAFMAATLVLCVLAACTASGRSTSARPDPIASSSTDVVTPSPPPQGAEATWTVDPTAPPSPDATHFRALVARLACHGGVTGEVLPPSVISDDKTVTVTFEVAADNQAAPGGFTCQSNQAVPYDVDLGGPLGTRKLVDGDCVSGKQALTTAFCTEESPVRWPSGH